MSLGRRLDETARRNGYTSRYRHEGEARRSGSACVAGRLGGPVSKRFV